MGALIQWAAAVLILYSFDWRRVPFIGTDDPQASSEVRLGLAVVGAILVVFVLNLLWQIIRHPALMDAELRGEMARQGAAAAEREHQLQARIARLTGAIDDARNAEALLKRMSKLYHDGRRIYASEDDRDAWHEQMIAWEAEVTALIDTNFSVSVMHQFVRGGHGMMLPTRWTAPDGDERSKYRFTARLMGLDDIVKHGAPLRTAAFRLLGEL